MKLENKTKSFFLCPWLPIGTYHKNYDNLDFIFLNLANLSYSFHTRSFVDIKIHISQVNCFLKKN